MTLPSNIIAWLRDRGIADHVIFSNGIEWNGTQIVIPIKDVNGTVLFNKYRRDPFGPTDIPKYKYEPGTTAQLYNAHKIKNAHFIIITEGELDALCIESKYIILPYKTEWGTEDWIVGPLTPVTSTGGAGTFKEEWFDLLKGKEVYVCFDNDEAGIRGAVRLLTRLPAKLILIPRTESTKDITDYFKTGGNFFDLIEEAYSFPILSEPIPKFKGIGDRLEHIKKYKHVIDDLMHRKRECKNTSKPFYHLDEVIRLLLIAIENIEREIRRIRRAKKPESSNVNLFKITDQDILRARQVPLEILYSGKLTKQGRRAVGVCPFHVEKTGSFTVYTDQNKWYCYGCSAGVDTIDYVMRRDHCDFIAAVKTLLKR